MIGDTLFGNLTDMAVENLRLHEPPEGYWLAFSGGKDSVVIKRLADMAGVKYTAHYNVTTIDPPELVRFIRREHPDVAWERAPRPFIARCVEKGLLPSRRLRWCCAEYKEPIHPSASVVIRGIRWEESRSRSARGLYEPCWRDKRKHYLNPIVAWNTHDVWSFIREERLPYCELYDQGLKRLGCIFCPMKQSRDRLLDAERYPGYYAAFVRACDKIVAARKARERGTALTNGTELMTRWLSDGPKAADESGWFAEQEEQAWASGD